MLVTVFRNANLSGKLITKTVLFILQCPFSIACLAWVRCDLYQVHILAHGLAFILSWWCATFQNYVPWVQKGLTKKTWFLHTVNSIHYSNRVNAWKEVVVKISTRWWRENFTPSTFTFLVWCFPARFCQLLPYAKNARLGVFTNTMTGDKSRFISDTGYTFKTEKSFASKNVTRLNRDIGIRAGWASHAKWRMVC